MQIFLADGMDGTDGTNEPTEGSTRGPRGPKKLTAIHIIGTVIQAKATPVK